MDERLRKTHELKFERMVDASPAFLWDGWTNPQAIVKWFAPLPWKTVAATIELKPGGLFETTMEAPDGNRFPNRGIFLQVDENSRLVWTNTLLPGYSPAAPSLGGFLFTAIIDFIPQNSGTLYRATVKHADEESKMKHEAMGFESGWNKALDQLLALNNSSA